MRRQCPRLVPHVQRSGLLQQAAELFERAHRHARFSFDPHPRAGHRVQHPRRDAHESVRRARAYQTAEHAESATTNHRDGLTMQRVPRVNDGTHTGLVRIMLYC